MKDKKELTEALIRDIKYLLRNEKQERENFKHLTIAERKVIERLRKYGKVHIIYNPKLERWVVSNKYKQ